MKIETTLIPPPIHSGTNALSLNDDDKKSIEAAFMKELETEHLQREQRAQEKLMRASNKRVSQQRQNEKEMMAIKSELRRKFYSEKGYKQSKDPTGRVMWLSPTEQEHHYRRRGKKKKSKLKQNFMTHKSSIYLYGSIITMGVLVALYIVKS